MLSYRFWKLDGIPLAAPYEGEAAILELNTLDLQLKVSVQGQPYGIYQRYFAGQIRTFIDWEARAAGHYILNLDGQLETITIAPAKIGWQGFARLLLDLSTDLPTALLFALQQTGGIDKSISQIPTHDLDTELARLKHAVLGDDEHLGLAQLLPAIAKSPHKMPHPERLSRLRVRIPLLQTAEEATEEATLIPLTAESVAVTEDTTPLTQKEVSYDLNVYENQLLKHYAQQISSRLNVLQYIPLEGEQKKTIEHLTTILEQAVQHADFLKQVQVPFPLRLRSTWISLKNALYREAMGSYLTFQRSAQVQLNDSLLHEPLNRLPELYQLWCILQIIWSLLQVAKNHHYQVETQTLCTQDKMKSWWIDLDKQGKSVLTLYHPTTQKFIRVIPRRVYAPMDKDFPQYPHLAIEIEHADAQMEVYLFDCQYRLNSQQNIPHKTDIDQLHAYRDAIRYAGEPLVKYTALLYPGTSQLYTTGIETIGAKPFEENILRLAIKRIFEGVLGGEADRA